MLRTEGPAHRAAEREGDQLLIVFLPQHTETDRHMLPSRRAEQLETQLIKYSYAEVSRPFWNSLSLPLKFSLWAHIRPGAGSEQATEPQVLTSQDEVGAVCGLLPEVADPKHQWVLHGTQTHSYFPSVFQVSVILGDRVQLIYAFQGSGR